MPAQIGQKLLDGRRYGIKKDEFQRIILPFVDAFRQAVVLCMEDIVNTDGRLRASLNTDSKMARGCSLA